MNRDGHLSAGEVEKAAATPDVLHMLRCENCAGMILHLAETLETTPLFEYPAAE